jgi:hypothetical protein
MNTLYATLGQFYFTTHTNTPPTFLQVIGWTKGAEQPTAKRLYVYVRKVPLVVSHGRCGGCWEFDNNIIEKYASEITTPVRKNTPQVDGNAIVIEGAHFIRYQSITVPQKTFEFAPISIPKPDPIPEPDPELDIIEELLGVSSPEPIQYNRL